VFGSDIKICSWFLEAQRLYGDTISHNIYIHTWLATYIITTIFKYDVIGKVIKIIFIYIHGSHVRRLQEASPDTIWKKQKNIYYMVTSTALIISFSR
jgi:hypothetical protein